MADLKSSQEVVIFEGETGTATSSDMLMDGYRGLVVYVTVNSVSTDDVTVKVQRKSPTSATDYEDLAGGTTAAISSTGLTTLAIYPGIAETANVSVSDIIGAVFRIVATVSGGGSIDYDVAIAPVP